MVDIKNHIKGIFQRYGIWYPLNLLRNTPEILNWLRSGCRGFAPHPIKMMVVKSYLKRFSVDEFIETGTYLGDTLGYIASSGVQCTSIELSQQLYEIACNKFKTCSNVKLVQGDSGKKLPELLNGKYRRALFWLDGHYSSGVTARSEVDTPIIVELEAILGHPIKQHVILIDDARRFDGTNNYPHLDDLLRIIREDGSYIAEVSIDIIRLVPRLGL